MWHKRWAESPSSPPSMPAPSPPQFAAPRIPYGRGYAFPTVQQMEEQKAAAPAVTICGLRKKVFYVVIGFGYPAFLLTTIVATANHYFMDALAATCFVCIAFYCNKVFYVFIPLEDLLLFIIRADKPVPTTGDRIHERGGRI